VGKKLRSEITRPIKLIIRSKYNALELKETYPDKPQAKAPAFRRISNARKETLDLGDVFEQNEQ